MRQLVVEAKSSSTNPSTHQTARGVEYRVHHTPSNIRRLLEALAPFDPHHASKLDLPGISESPEVLATWRLLMIETDLGRLDVLNEMAPIGRYERARFVERSIDEGVVRVLAIDQLIDVKRHVARPKDLLVAEELSAIEDLD